MLPTFLLDRYVFKEIVVNFIFQIKTLGGFVLPKFVMGFATKNKSRAVQCNLSFAFFVVVFHNEVKVILKPHLIYRTPNDFRRHVVLNFQYLMKLRYII